MGEKTLFQPKVTKMAGPCAYPFYSCPFVAFLAIPEVLCWILRNHNGTLCTEAPNLPSNMRDFSVFSTVMGGGDFGLFLSTCREVLCHPACLVVYNYNLCGCAKHLVMRVRLYPSYSARCWVLGDVFNIIEWGLSRFISSVIIETLMT